MKGRIECPRAGAGAFVLSTVTWLSLASGVAASSQEESVAAGRDAWRVFRGGSNLTGGAPSSLPDEPSPLWGP